MTGLPINFLIVTCLTLFVEAILSERFENLFLELQINQENEIVINLIEANEKALANATFRTYDQLAKDLFGHSLSVYTTNETWDGISKLFSLRNQVVHGRRFKYLYTRYTDDSVLR